MIEVTSKVSIYEVKDETVPIGKNVEMDVSSHWNHDEWVVLKFQGKEITVNAADLKAAINNATNTERF